MILCLPHRLSIIFGTSHAFCSLAAAAAGVLLRFLRPCTFPVPPLIIIALYFQPSAHQQHRNLIVRYVSPLAHHGRHYHLDWAQIISPTRSMQPRPNLKRSVPRRVSRSCLVRR